MKTISITDEAYERLRSWTGPDARSFSQVILAVVPKKGTLADLAVEIDRLPNLTPDQEEAIEAAAAWGKDWRNQRDPWTT